MRSRAFGKGEGMMKVKSEVVAVEALHDNAASRPALSVIVPVYNSAECLKQCLAALARSQFDDFEALVVDDGSDEPVESLAASFGFKYLRIDGPGGPARARNLGAAQVNGRYIVFIDADVCIHPDALTRFAATLDSNPGIAAVIGSYDDSPADRNFLSQYKNLFHHYVHHASDGEIPTFWSGCGAIRREEFLAFGGFDDRRYRRPAIEDIELGVWMTAAGRRIKLDSRIRGKHLKRWTLLGLLKTDIFDRGVPWTRLMLRAGAMANTLNVKPAQRASVALVGLTCLSLLAALSWPKTLIAAAVFALVVTALNFDFYRFFAARSGIWFALRVAPLHWLYFIYCGFSVVLGTFLHYLDVARSGRGEEGEKRRQGDRETRKSYTLVSLSPLLPFFPSPALLFIMWPLAILALAYVWLAVDHGTLWLWGVTVHESGRYTLRETVFYFGHFLREIPVDVGMALFILAGFIKARGSVQDKSVERASAAWSSRILLAAAVGLMVVAVSIAAGRNGWAKVALDLLQFRTRDNLSEYGSHWQFHWLSTLWFGVAAMVGAPAIAWLCGQSYGTERQSQKLWMMAWGYFAALTAIFGVTGRIFTDARYVGHQAREIMTHGLITYPLAYGVLYFFATRLFSTRDRLLGRAAINFRPTDYIQAALVFLIPVYLGVVTLMGEGLEAGQPERGLAAMIGAHAFEHALDYLLVVFLVAGGYACYAWLIARRLERSVSI